MKEGYVWNRIVIVADVVQRYLKQTTSVPYVGCLLGGARVEDSRSNDR